MTVFASLRIILCAILFSFGLSSVTFAAQPVPIPKPPSIGAKSHILMDFHSGKVLAENEPETQFAPASLTKLMTAYAVFQELATGNISPEDLVPVSEKAWRTPGSRMFIEVGKKVKVDDLMQGLIVQSGNDAAVALAEYIAGTEETFAGLMNRYAATLGMAQTEFFNATGLPKKGHLSSAKDMAILAEAIVREFPQYYHWYSQREFTYADITQYNRNKLLARDESVDGMKTGFTVNAGYCLVTSAERDGMRLISVVLGSKTAKTRINESQALLNYGFRFFETRRLYKAGESLAHQKVWKSSQDTITVGLADDLYVTIPRKQYEELTPAINIESMLVGPVTKGQQLGNLEVILGEKVVITEPLIALQGADEGNYWHKMRDSVLLWFE